MANHYVIKIEQCNKCDGFGHLARKDGIGIRNCSDCLNGRIETHVSLIEGLMEELNIPLEYKGSFKLALTKP